VAWGEAARITGHGPQRFASVDSQWRAMVAAATVSDPVGVPGSGLVAFGSFSFDEDSATGGVLVVPRVVVGRRGGRAWLTTIDAMDGAAHAVGTDAGSAHDPSSDETNSPALPVSWQTIQRTTPPTDHGAVTWQQGSMTPEQWGAVVADAVATIRAGEVDKVVMARDVVAVTERPLDLRVPLGRLAADYESCWTFSVDGLFGATPELLVRSDHGLVTSRVLAGTIRRTGDEAADVARAAILAHSSKDLEEHEYAVDSVANAIGPFCWSINVPETPFVLHLPNVLHLASDVTGVLAPPTSGSENEPVSSLQLAAALHPSAAVCGTPRAAANGVIRRIEGMERGRYAGPVGWIGADGDGEWGIALRCAAVDPADPTRIRLFAGCGIVAASDPAAELAESEAKLIPLRSALAGPAPQLEDVSELPH